ncbi:hypothetical protein ABIE89_006683 [Bradyrhizobium niftali]
MPLALIETGYRPACRILGSIRRCKELKGKNIGHCPLNAVITSGLGHKPPNTFKVGNFRFALVS